MTTLRHRRGQPRALSNQVVAITGGARGIGHATARALAHQGARVAIGDLDGDLADDAATELGGGAFGIGGLRGMPFIGPEDVAARIVETLQRPRFDVPVPKSIGPMLWLNQALPFRARLAHLTKADDVLSHIDADERAAYVERVNAGAA